MGRGILRGAGGDENLKSNFIWPYIVNFFYIKFMLGFFIWFLIIVSDRLFSSAKSNKKTTTLKVIRAKITLKEK